MKQLGLPAIDELPQDDEEINRLLQMYNTDGLSTTEKNNISKKINNIIDTNQQGAEVIMPIVVTGIQKNPEGLNVKAAKVVSSSSKEYLEGEEIEMVVEFSESVFADENKTPITESTAPELMLEFENLTTANNPVAVVAALENTQLKLAEQETRKAIFVSSSKNKIKYKYIAQEGDKGVLKIVGMSGNVYSKSGQLLNISEKKTPTIVGNSVIANVVDHVINVKSITITSDTNKEYDYEDVLTLAVEFNETAYSNANKQIITPATAPVLQIQFNRTEESSSIMSIVADVFNSRILSTNTYIRTATFVNVVDNVLNYKYVIQKGDVGTLSIVNLSGDVYTKRGMKTSLTRKELSGNNVIGISELDLEVDEVAIKINGQEINTSNTIEMYVANTATLSLEGTRTIENVQYSSNSTSIVTIDSTGLITARAAGTTKLILTGQGSGKRVELNIKIKNREIDEATIKLNGNTFTTDTTINLKVGETATVTLQNTYTLEAKQFSSNSTSIATVTSAGVITGKAAGTTKIIITGSESGKTIELNVVVKNREIDEATIKLNGSTITTSTTINVDNGSTATLALQHSYTLEAVQYSSNSTSIATVSTSGVITGKAVGTTKIVITGNESGKKIELNVNVNASGPQIKINGQTVTLTKDNVANYYGRVVKNYNSNTAATWRLFYVDFDNDFKDGAGTIYLKADNVGNTALTATTETAGLDRMKLMNPKWVAKDGNANATNEKAAVWLCDENVWNTKYSDSKLGASAKAKYAIGAPSVEMYIKSYNAYHSKKGTNGYQELKCDWYSSNTSGYKYAVGTGSYVNNTANNSLKADENNMYVKSDGYWWLASPSASDSSCVCIVYGGYFRLYYGSYSGSYGACPLVSLKSGIIPELQ